MIASNSIFGIGKEFPGFDSYFACAYKADVLAYRDGIVSGASVCYSYLDSYLTFASNFAF